MPRKLTRKQRVKLREAWRQFRAAEERVRRLAEEAEASGDYSYYDEQRADLHEAGTEFAHQFAEALGLDSPFVDMDGDA